MVKNPPEGCQRVGGHEVSQPAQTGWAVSDPTPEEIEAAMKQYG